MVSRIVIQVQDVGWVPTRLRRGETRHQYLSDTESWAVDVHICPVCTGDEPTPRGGPPTLYHFLIEILQIVDNDTDIEDEPDFEDQDIDENTSFDVYMIPVEDEIEEPPIDFPDIMPKFPGGDFELLCFIDNNINKGILQKSKVEGKSWAKFTIDTTGQVTDIRIIKSLSEMVDNELLRVISLMPRWTPGERYNKLIEVDFSIPLIIPYENKNCY